MRTVVTLLFIFSIYLAFGNNSNSDDKLNTAANVSYLSTLEKEVVYEINLLRSNPAKYADKYIVPLANKYKNKMFYYPGDKPLKTREGVRALTECVSVLKRTRNLPLVYPSKGLSKAAEDHVKDQSKSGKTGHRGSDFSNVKQRIERYGNWKLRIGENIAYGGLSARQIVIYLLIDDGIRDRGHRKTFLHPDYKAVGVATGSHPGYESMWVMDFGGAFTEK